MKMVDNEAGVVNARKVMIGGKEYVATHRNPMSGDIYVEDYYVGVVNGVKTYGKWFRPDAVRFI